MIPTRPRAAHGALPDTVWKSPCGVLDALRSASQALSWGRGSRHFKILMGLSHTIVFQSKPTRRTQCSCALLYVNFT